MARTGDKTELLDPAFMARLEQLDVVSRKIFAGKMKGDRKSKRKGESVEFADYRNYVVGDDLRFLDWNIYARLDRLFLKLFLEEEDLPVSILLDLSKSMDFGEPNKALYAKRVAAALAYVALVNYNRVTICSYDDRLAGDLSGVRGRRLMHQVVAFLQDQRTGGPSNLAAACRQFAIRHKPRGVLVVLSDFFDKSGFETGLRYLVRRDLDVYALQLLSPEEINPTISGDLRLVDIEDADVAEVTVSRPLITRYKANLQAYCEALKSFCTRRDVMYLFASTEVPFDQLVLSYLRQRGLLR
ncbi:MAG: DUF58 domain-containing protein [Phycisphaerae bacterium]|nr:DUF58 domain-containing protein [Phycisphaerae bacterium]